MEIPVYKTQGIILKKADLNDTGRLLTIYTQNFGKILVRARGVGKRESKLKSLIEPFNIYEFMLARSVRSIASNGARTNGIDVLANSYPIKEFLGLRQNLEALSLAIYFAELVDKLIPAPEQDPKIWLLLTRAMEAVDQNSNPPHPSFSKGGSQKVPPFEKGRVGGIFTPSKLKEAFEERLLGYLGHPSTIAQGKFTEREKSNYLASLAGEEIKAGRFL